jgi:DNA-binding response OmpR family regulator
MGHKAYITRSEDHQLLYLSFNSDKNAKMMGMILWIEGSKNVTPSFLPSLRKTGYQVTAVSTGKEAMAFVSSQVPNLAIVNTASLRSSGERICGALHNKMNGQPILLIGNKRKESRDAYATQVLILPFTIRKLINRIKALIPEECHDVIKVGTLSIYPELRIVRCHEGDPKRLTPRQFALLKILMEHPGEVIERDQLFREVWQTDYVEDTRTLDVHISWLRKKIEEDHRNPQLLKTIRSVGYRLDV